MSTDRMSPASYLILGLLAREGPSTPYDLERQIAATLGKFWSFTHTLLYRESTRLASEGLLTETQEPGGRHRRVFTITEGGMAALDAWLDQPSSQPTELRDVGLLQLFFTDLAPEESRLRLARQQLAIHTAKLLAYQHEADDAGGPTELRRGQRTMEHWRGATLRMGLRYEAAAVDFWTELIAEANGSAQPG